MRIVGACGELLLVAALAAIHGGGKCSEAPGPEDLWRAITEWPRIGGQDSSPQGLQLSNKLLGLDSKLSRLQLHKSVHHLCVATAQLRALSGSQEPPADKLDWAFRFNSQLVDCVLKLGLKPMLDGSAPSYMDQLKPVINGAKQALARLSESLAGLKLELTESLKRVD